MSYSSKGILNNLVTQFASPYDAMRELVQNSIDAGTSSVDVWVDYQSSSDGAGVVALHVDDYGEGMNEEIIDKQFTKLFASKKEGDLTKIGKFGIGFVSVFALEPEGVLVHTGRGGEYWEVLFHPDRSFSKTRIDTPVEGTQITIFLKGTPASTRDVAKSVFDSLKKWCVYAETEITFENRFDPNGDIEIINEEFHVEGDFLTKRVFEDGSVYAVAFSNRPLYAFYNRGLTLAYTDVAENVIPQSQVKSVTARSVKIKSRFLEHTLSRDSVVRDENYERAMARLKSVIELQLPQTIVSTLMGLNDASAVDVYRTFVQSISCFVYYNSRTLRSFESEPFLIGFGGRRYTPMQVFKTFKETGSVFMASEPTDAVEKLHEKNVPVIWGPCVAQAQVSRVTDPGFEIGLQNVLEGAMRSTIWGVIRAAFGYRLPIRLAIAHPNVAVREVSPIEVSEHGLALIQDARKVIHEHVSQLISVEPAAIIPKSLGEEMIFFEKVTAEWGLVSGALRDTPRKYINAEHPHFLDLVEVYKTNRSLAVYGLARAFILQIDQRGTFRYELMDDIRRTFDPEYTR